MKKILLIVVSAALSFACGNSERERIDKADIKAMTERQRAMAEKTGAQNMDVKYNSKSVSSSTGGYAREENSNKDVLVAGDNGIFAARSFLIRVNLGSCARLCHSSASE